MYPLSAIKTLSSSKAVPHRAALLLITLVLCLALPAALVAQDLDQLATQVADAARPGDHVVVMSNGGFGGMPGRILERLAQRDRPLAAGAGA